MTATWMSTRRAFLGACLALPVLVRADQRAVPTLMLANVYRDEIAADLSRFWVSEKLDGVRAYWDGSRFVTRAGNSIAAPGWFTAGLPRIALDGELWGGRNAFERTSGTVRTATPDEDAWRGLKYMAFDMPGEGSAFNERLRRLEELSNSAKTDWFAIVPQVRVRDSGHLRAKLREVEALGGEGLMLHRGTSMYVSGRSDDLLKLKSFEDAEAKVIGHAPGQGKYEGMLGALIVEREDGAQFRIGSGLSDIERTTPPPVGSWVTYAFNGLTNSGLPRFPRFVRVRVDAGDR